jgi:hypothetical protein
MERGFIMKSKSTAKWTASIVATIGMLLLAAKCDDEAGVASGVAPTQSNPMTTRSEESTPVVAPGASVTTVVKVESNGTSSAAAGKIHPAVWQEGSVNDAGDPEHEALVRLVYDTLNYTNHETFYQAIHDVGPRAIPVLWELARDESKKHQARQRAILSLGAIGDANAVEPMIAFYEENRQRNLQEHRHCNLCGSTWASLGLLAGQGSDRALRYLGGLLEPEFWAQNPDLVSYRGSLINALAASGRPEAKKMIDRYFDSLKIKAKKQPLTEIEKGELEGLRDSVYKFMAAIKLTGILGVYNPEVRKQKGIVDNSDLEAD